MTLLNAPGQHQAHYLVLPRGGLADAGGDGGLAGLSGLAAGVGGEGADAVNQGVVIHWLLEEIEAFLEGADGHRHVAVVVITGRLLPCSRRASKHSSPLISRIRMSSTMQPRQSGCQASRKASADSRPGRRPGGCGTAR